MRVFGPKQDPWHTRPDDKQETEASYPQDEADQTRAEKKRRWAGRVAEAALEIIGEVIEGILDNI